MGNPHAVQTVADVDAAPVKEEGPLNRAPPRFSETDECGYMQVVDRSSVRLRVWERGAAKRLPVARALARRS